MHEDFHKKVPCLFKKHFGISDLINACDYVKPAHYINTINSFYRRALSHYPIKFIVFHEDEISSPHDDGLAVYLHIFIDEK